MWSFCQTKPYDRYWYNTIKETKGWSDAKNCMIKPTIGTYINQYFYILVHFGIILCQIVSWVAFVRCFSGPGRAEGLAYDFRALFLHFWCFQGWDRWCLILFDIVWYCWILFDIVWYCLILFGIVWYHWNPASLQLLPIVWVAKNDMRSIFLMDCRLDRRRESGGATLYTIVIGTISVKTWPVFLIVFGSCWLGNQSCKDVEAGKPSKRTLTHLILHAASSQAGQECNFSRRRYNRWSAASETFYVQSLAISAISAANQPSPMYPHLTISYNLGVYDMGLAIPGPWIHWNMRWLVISHHINTVSLLVTSWHTHYHLGGTVLLISGLT